MDYQVKLNWQEDENAPRGTRYWVEFANDRVLIETNGTSWHQAMTEALDKLQEAGEI
jgi:hypothetical protein